jgi:hypothetical protein
VSHPFDAAAEPSPEVTHVRDRIGVVWRRDGDLWWGNIGHTGEDGSPYEDFRQWHDIARRGPLTDATGEA